jgi:DNA-binding PucR family transcriptional regulator
VSAEYRDELEQTRRSSSQKQTARILRLLESNSLTSPTDLDYNFDIWHVGMIFFCPDAEESARALTKSLGYRSLSAVRDEEITWVWFGSPQKPLSADLERVLTENAPPEVSVAIGEPREGLDGWRQTHHEAQIALQVMLYQPQPITRCRDVILDSAVVRDQWLAMSLIETYLAPLDGRGNSGEVLRRTLRAYFKADRNIASAALALGVARHTVERHLHRVEAQLGQNLDTCNAQLQVALRAEELVTSPGRTRQLSSA